MQQCNKGGCCALSRKVHSTKVVGSFSEDQSAWETFVVVKESGSALVYSSSSMTAGSVEYICANVECCCERKHQKSWHDIFWRMKRRCWRWSSRAARCWTVAGDSQVKMWERRSGKRTLLTLRTPTTVLSYNYHRHCLFAWLPHRPMQRQKEWIAVLKEKVWAALMTERRGERHGKWWW